MNDLDAHWIVMLGAMYLCGLGQTFTGYHSEPVTGYVFSRMKERAYLFTGQQDALIYSNRIGGQVFKV